MWASVDTEAVRKDDHWSPQGLRKSPRGRESWALEEGGNGALLVCSWASAAFVLYPELLVSEVRMEIKAETLVGTYVCTLDQELKGLQLILHRELGSC